MQLNSSHARIVAVLGPTNTGKTHLALERMMGHASGMIGFPLRLLARENYDRVVEAKGRSHVALITGEEKIVPKGARYFLCTVESMPIGRRVDFLGIDEVQLCADPDRGHVFTDRLLHARGEHETMFMGAETIAPLIRRLVPDVEITGRPRFSTLTYAGSKKVTRLPPRSAVVAFSASDVYALAEMVRRQRGGAAVVLGALSPRTRNAQVGMFQAGEVDYLVATDAIGMGLNMDVDHVAFAGLRKFDGRSPRPLHAPELAQIAGRAGRHMNDGTFGTTADAGDIDPEIIDRVETHTFDKLRQIQWRNRSLRYTSLEALKDSLMKTPEIDGLVRAREADDQRALDSLSGDPEIAALAQSPENIELLWEVCQIPDFQKVMSDAHARLLSRTYRHLMEGRRKLPTDWVASHVDRIDRTDGDIDTLVQRIANIRTWTYMSHRAGWMDDQLNWQGRTRQIEDKLSDALHDRLTKRFVDQRTSVLLKRLRDRQELVAAVKNDGEVIVEGHHVGYLSGFRFKADSADTRHGAKAVTGAAMKALRREIVERVMTIENEPNEAFSLSPKGEVVWREATIAQLTKGAEVLKPGISILPSDLLEGTAHEKIEARLSQWVAETVATRLEPMIKAGEAELNGPAKGLVFQLCEVPGFMAREAVAGQIAALGRPDRQALRDTGIRLGRLSAYFPALLKPAPAHLCALLWAVFNEEVDNICELPPGRVNLEVQEGVPEGYYEAAGYRKFGRLAVRLDMLERIAGLAFRMSRAGLLYITPDLLSLAGCTVEDMDAILKGIGYRAVSEKRKKPEMEALDKLLAEQAKEAKEKKAKAYAAAKAAERGEAPRTQEEAKPEETPAAEEAKADEEKPTEEKPAEETPASEEAKPETTETPVEAKPAEEAKPEADAKDEAQDEEVELTVYRWGPKRERRPRREGQRSGDRKPRRDAKGGKRDDRKDGPRKGKGKPREKGPKTFTAGGKKEQYDPHSPFAALKDLKLKK